MNVFLFLPTDAQPLDLTVVSVTHDSITISWTAVQGNIVYQIFYPVPGGLPFQTASTFETVTLAGLSQGTLYNITVRANTITGQVEVGRRLITTCMFLAFKATLTQYPEIASSRS